jgi:hypothetical protein
MARNFGLSYHAAARGATSGLPDRNFIRNPGGYETRKKQDRMNKISC